MGLVPLVLNGLSRLTADPLTSVALGVAAGLLVRLVFNARSLLTGGD